MGKPRSKLARFVRLSLLWFLAVAGSFVGCTCIASIPPKSFQAVKEPRPGQALNQRVAVVYSTHYQINLGGFERLHSFDIRKYARIYLKLQTEGLLWPQDVFVPEAVTDAQCLLVHTPAFLDSLKDPATVARYLELPALKIAPAGLVDAAILNAFRYATGGTVLAGRLAVKHGIAVNLSGGYNHAKPDSGGGFNVYADVPIAIRVLQKEGIIKRAAVIDLDIHQGDGEAACFLDDPDVFTFSMHEGDIYPPVKGKPTLSVPLPPGLGDEEYLTELRKHLASVLDRAKPEIVFYIAGCDPLAGDPLANERLTPQGIVQRDAEVIDACAARGIPVAMVLGGGYSERAWEAQYLSVRRTILKYGATGAAPHPPRKATVQENVYTK